MRYSDPRLTVSNPTTFYEVRLESEASVFDLFTYYEKQLIFFFFKGSGAHRDLHSSPPRRSSDLPSRRGLSGKRHSAADRRETDDLASQSRDRQRQAASDRGPSRHASKDFREQLSD